MRSQTQFYDISTCIQPSITKSACNCWFDSKHWNLGNHSVSLFYPWQPHHEAPSSPSRPLTSHLCVSRQDQARLRLACLEGQRLHQPTYTLRFALGLLLGKTVNMACLPLSPLIPLPVFHRFCVLPSPPPLAAHCPQTVIPVNSGVKAPLTSDPLALHLSEPPGSVWHVFIPHCSVSVNVYKYWYSQRTLCLQQANSNNEWFHSAVSE